MQPIIEVILNLQTFILFCIIIMMPLSATLIWLANHFKWKNSAYVGLLYESNTRLRFFLSIEILSFFLIMWIFTMHKADYISASMFVILLIIAAIFNPIYNRIPLQLINGVMSIIAMIFATILLDYSQLVQYNFNLVLLYYLIGGFVVLYNLFHFIKMLELLSKTRIDRGNRYENEL